MKVEVQLVNELGRALFTSERTVKAPKHVGDLQLTEERSNEYGRSTLVARLQDTRGGIREPIVPVLIDARVLWVKGDEIRLRGTERIDGVEYAQAWVAIVHYRADVRSVSVEVEGRRMKVSVRHRKAFRHDVCAPPAQRLGRRQRASIRCGAEGRSQAGGCDLKIDRQHDARRWRQA